ncbi:MAG: hypothetical protein WC730_00985 [Patescibacteria group bacterium]|jgi:hypothetical protein
MKNHLVKKEQIVAGMSLLAGTIMFALLILALSLRLPSQLSTWEALAVSLFLCPFFDYSWIIINKAKTQRAEWKTDSSTFEKAHLYYDIIKGIFGILLICAIGIGLGYLFLRETTGFLVGASFFVQIGVYFLYFVFLRKPIRKLFKGAISKVQPKSSKFIPHYELKGDSVSLDLGIQDLHNREKRFVITFSFTELEKLEVMTYLEAQQFMKYQSGLGLGERISTGASSIREKIEFIRKGERPNYYSDVRDMRLPVLIMMGPEILYAVSVGNEENEGLVNAFNEYKQK